MSNHGGLGVLIGLFVTLGLPAQNSPEVVARWKHLGNPIALYSNGKINDTSSEIPGPSQATPSPCVGKTRKRPAGSGSTPAPSLQMADRSRGQTSFAAPFRGP